MDPARALGRLQAPCVSLTVRWRSAAGGGWLALGLGSLLLWIALPVAALDWHPIPEGRWAELAPPASPRPGFTQLESSITGIRFTNELSPERYLTNTMLLNGAGVALGDVDGDGWCDLFLASLAGRSALYRNLGHWQFEDITRAAGVSCPDLTATGAVFADVDGDGDLGLYVTNYRFWTMRDAPGLQVSIALVDGKRAVSRVEGRSVTEPDLTGRFSLGPGGELEENGEVDELYRNDGAGNFSLVAFTGGAFLDEDGKVLTEPPYDWG